MDDEELALALAIMLTSRSKSGVEISLNTPEVFKDIYTEKVFQKKLDDLDKLRETPLDIQGAEYAKKAIDSKSALCGELADILLLISSLIRVENNVPDYDEKEFFISKFQTDKHTFCVLHKSKIFSDDKMRLVEFPGHKLATFKDLSEVPGLEESIILDPLVYSVYKTSQADDFFEKSLNKNFKDSSKDFYDGPVAYLGETQKIKVGLQNMANDNIEEKIQKEFSNMHKILLSSLGESGIISQYPDLEKLRETLRHTILIEEKFESFKAELLSETNDIGIRDKIISMTLDDLKKFSNTVQDLEIQVISLLNKNCHKEIKDEIGMEDINIITKGSLKRNAFKEKNMTQKEIPYPLNIFLKKHEKKENNKPTGKGLNK